MDKLTLALLIVSTTVTSAVGLLAIIAPLTKTDKDNKALAALRWVESVLLKLVLPGRKV